MRTHRLHHWHLLGHGSMDDPKFFLMIAGFAIVATAVTIYSYASLL